MRFLTSGHFCRTFLNTSNCQLKQYGFKMYLPSVWRIFLKPSSVPRSWKQFIFLPNDSFMENRYASLYVFKIYKINYDPQDCFGISGGQWPSVSDPGALWYYRMWITFTTMVFYGSTSGHLLSDTLVHLVEPGTDRRHHINVYQQVCTLLHTVVAQRG